MNFPKTVYLSIGGSGENEFLIASDTELKAIKGTDDEETARVAEYQLVQVRHRTITVTSLPHKPRIGT
jgi:hypothetical protein